MVKLLNRAIVRLQLRKCYNYKGGFTMEEKLAARCWAYARCTGKDLCWPTLSLQLMLY